MANVYTALLWEEFNLLGGLTASSNPPAGTLWVVRHMVLVNTSTDNGILQGTTVTDSIGVPLLSIRARECWAGVTYTWEGHQVIGPSDNLVMTLPDAGWNIRVTGYQLTLP